MSWVQIHLRQLILIFSLPRVSFFLSLSSISSVIMYMFNCTCSLDVLITLFTFITCFQDSHAKAKNCLLFLSTLSGPCTELANAEPKDIPALLPRLLNTVRIIWMNSEHYQSRDRLTALLGKVCVHTYNMSIPYLSIHSFIVLLIHPSIYHSISPSIYLFDVLTL